MEAVDPDEGDNGRVVYKISYSPNNDSEVFAINPDTGEVYANETPLSPGKHTIIVNASDQPADPKEMKYSLAVITITIVVEGIVHTSYSHRNRIHLRLSTVFFFFFMYPPWSTDIINPDFVNAPYEFWVGSDVPVGTSVGQVRVVSQNPDVDYDLLHTYPEGGMASQRR